MSVNLNPPLTQKPIARYEKSPYLCAVKPSFFHFATGLQKKCHTFAAENENKKIFICYTIIIITSMNTSMRFIAANITMSIIMVMNIITATSIIMNTIIMSTAA